jgi:hypothetical protein
MTLVSVRVRDCACPGTPHEEDGDVVFLTPTLSAVGGIAAEQDMSNAEGDHEALTRQWLITFVRYGATGWNLEDDDGPRPFDVDDLLADWAIARPVAIRAGELYQAAVIAPFLPAPSKRSPTGRTRATTSRRPSPTRASSA